MSYRDDHEAAVMRADAAERELARVTADHARVEAELAQAREWLGGPKKRLFLLGGIIVLGIGLVLAGVVIGRATVGDPRASVRAVEPRQPPLPAIYGVIVADGPRVGHWTLNATRCAQRQDGIELTEVGSTDHHIWLANDQVEVETPHGDFFIEKKHCFAKLVAVVARRDDVADGYVELDCHFDDNRLQGRIDFKNCGR